MEVLKIYSWNVNGIRSVTRKGMAKWLTKSKPDILCMQELKAGPNDLPESITKAKGYHLYTSHATKKGYSGVGVLTREKPLKVQYKLGLSRFDKEGRILLLEYRGFILLNLYMPHGGRAKENLDHKLAAYKKLLSFIKKYPAKKMILIGDFNIAHTEIDLARPKQNKNNIMFTPKERDQLDKLINLGFIDTFRSLHKSGDHYTWWPYFANARTRNLGWRIDYVFVLKTLEKNLNKAYILPKVTGSDHCPIGIELTI